MPVHFYMKQNDTKPVLRVDLIDANDQAVTLTGATVKFSMRVEPAGAVKVNKATASIVDAVKGTVEYPWVADGSDTNTSNDYQGEFEVTFAGGAVQTFPGRSYIAVHLIDDVA